MAQQQVQQWRTRRQQGKTVMRRWVDRFSVNTEPCLGLGLLKAAVLFSALITAAWRAWMYIFPFCVCAAWYAGYGGWHS
jgi:hypothetical protein